MGVLANVELIWLSICICCYLFQKSIFARVTQVNDLILFQFLKSRQLISADEQRSGVSGAPRYRWVHHDSNSMNQMFLGKRNWLLLLQRSRGSTESTWYGSTTSNSPQTRSRRSLEGRQGESTCGMWEQTRRWQTDCVDRNQASNRWEESQKSRGKSEEKLYHRATQGLQSFEEEWNVTMRAMVEKELVVNKWATERYVFKKTNLSYVVGDWRHLYSITDQWYAQILQIFNNEVFLFRSDFFTLVVINSEDLKWFHVTNNVASPNTNWCCTLGVSWSRHPSCRDLITQSVRRVDEEFDFSLSL